MASSKHVPPGEPGTLTSLLEEVFRGSEAEQAAWAEALTPGTALGRYDLIREVGRGGAGVVWEARDRELGRRVAVKVVRRPSDSVPERRLVAEAEVAARLSHPGIVTTLDIGRNEKGAWLVQEFLVGRTLAERLREGPVPVPDALRIGLRLAEALAYAHRHGVVHRDLSAANVFLCEDGQVKLLDLGMAQAFGRRKVEGGTRNSMAPEQARGEPEDERVDVYALGVLLHRMVAGEPPFPADAPPDRRRPSLLEVPEAPGLGELVERMLADRPAERPRDAAEVHAALAAMEAGLPRSGTETRTGAAVKVRRRAPRRLAAVAVAGLVLAAGAGGFALGRARAAAAPRLPSNILFGAIATNVACNWGKADWFELDRVPEAALVRHGELGGTGIAEVAGRKAWRVDSDWGQIVLPLGRAGTADTFAIEAEFYIPPVTSWMRGASLHVFVEPEGGPRRGDMRHGVQFNVAQEPGRPPMFDFLEWRGTEGAGSPRYTGTLPEPFTGRWHLVRLEGSRSGRWLRVLLDGRPMAVAHGEYDLSGTKVILGAGYGYMNPEHVAWSNLRLFAGTSECQ